MTQLELHVTLDQIATLELFNVSYYMRRFCRETGLYIIRFTCDIEYSKAKYSLGAGAACH